MGSRRRGDLTLANTTLLPAPAPMLLSWADRMTKLEPWIKDRAAEAGQEFLGGAGFTDR